MNFKEARQIVKMLSNEWDLGKSSSKAKGNVCAWIYLFEILEESEGIVLEKRDNRVVGICGYSKYNSNKHLIRKKIFKILKNALINSHFIKDKEGLYNYFENYNYTPKDLQKKYDGEISILIVDKKYRGNRLGKKILIEVFEMAKKDGLKTIQILSDESCNFEFYNKIGCKKTYEKKIFNKEKLKCGIEEYEMAFIFEKNLV